MVAVFLVGIFKCFFGLKYENSRIFLTGLEFGCICLWYSYMTTENGSLPETLFFVMIVWSLIWLCIFKWIRPVAKAREVVPNLILGWLFACYLLYMIANADFLINILNYWMMFATIVLVTVAVFIAFTNWGVLWTTSLLGAFYVALSCAFIFKSNLIYAILNNIRRTFVPEYNFVNIKMHFGIPGELSRSSGSKFLTIFILFLLFNRNLSCFLLVCSAYDEYCLSIKGQIHSIEYR